LTEGRGPQLNLLQGEKKRNEREERLSPRKKRHNKTVRKGKKRRKKGIYRFLRERASKSNGIRTRTTPDPKEKLEKKDGSYSRGEEGGGLTFCQP